MTVPPAAARRTPDTAPTDKGGDTPDRQRQALLAALRTTGLSLRQLWVRGFALGGDADLFELEAFLADLMPLPPRQRDAYAQAMNEHLAELRPPAPVPLSQAVRMAPPRTGPLAALTGLLDQSRYGPPERLPILTDAAARTMGLAGAVIYLIDHEQQHLTPLPTPGQPPREPLAVEGTLPGRAFTTGQTTTAHHDGTPGLWVPIIDGDERLGVLDARFTTTAELDRPSSGERSGWLASLLGHVIAGASTRGDHLNSYRRTSDRSPSAELIWALLPPLTAGVDDFTVSGLLAPAYDVGGDIFDYSLSERTASLAVFDAMGHGLRASLIAAATLAAYRSARRAGLSLHAQADAIDDSLAALFPDAFATGVLAELDLQNGQITYLNAGHPHPLLLRAGSVVASLAAGSRTPFGIPGPPHSTGSATLERGDCLALYTDGITEARDTTGTFFGTERLTDHLVRAASTGQSPPETVRRLLAGVLSHQEGTLQDDATLVLAQWATTDRHPRHRTAPTEPPDPARESPAMTPRSPERGE